MAIPPSALNPYASFIGADTPDTQLASTPATLARLISGLDDARLTRSPTPGKWSIRDILAHLADCEITFAFRLRQTVAEDRHVIQPFDQEHWAAPYSGYSVKDALDTFTSLRHWNLAFVKTVSPGARTKPVIHPERGEMTFQTIIETMGGHDRNHIKQIEKLAAK